MIELENFLSQPSRVDFQRKHAAKLRIKNGDSFQTCLREDINNASAYGADEILYCNHYNPEDDKDRLICGHTGEAFHDAMDIARALRFNMGKSLGAQNSGIPASALLMNSNVRNISYGIFSKTKKDGDVCIMSDYLNDNEFTSSIKTEKVREELKILFGDDYDKYNVFYIRSYNHNNINKNLGSGKKSPLICNDMNFHALSMICDYKGINVYYINQYIDGIKPYSVKNKTKSENDIQNYVAKKFELVTKGVKYLDKDLGETKKHIFNAKVEILCLSCIKDDGYKDTSYELYNRSYRINGNRKVTENTYRKFNVFTYQDYKNKIDLSNRLNNEPIMTSSSLPTYLDILGVEPIGDHRFVGEDIINNEDIKEVFDEYFDIPLNLDYKKYTIRPIMVMRIYIENVKDFDLIGSVDNTFMCNESRRLHEIQKKIFEKLDKDNSDELINFKKYTKKLISKVNAGKFLSCEMDKIISSNVEFDLIMTEEALALRQLFNWDCLPNKIGVKVKTLPENTKVPIPLKIKSLIGDEYITTDNVKCSNEGVTISYLENGIYGFLVSPTYHYDEKGKKVFHPMEDHLFSKNYFPKKTANHLVINGKFFKTNFSINIPININKPPSINDNNDYGLKPKKDDGRDYSKNEPYRFYDNPNIVGKFNISNNELLLNTNNYLIKKLCYEKPSNAEKIWKRVLIKLYENVANHIYNNQANPLLKYDFKGIERDIHKDGFSNENEALLSYWLEKYIIQDEDCKKLMDLGTINSADDSDVVHNVIEELEKSVYG